MRREFGKYLHARMKEDERIVIVSADLGAGLWDAIRAEFPNRFFNVGAAEQLMMGAAVGLAQEGKIPVTYTITPFLWRCAETLRLYANHEGANIKIIGSGRNTDYSEDGKSHDATDDKDLFRCFPGIVGQWPNSVDEMQMYVSWMLAFDGPVYLNLRR